MTETFTSSTLDPLSLPSVTLEERGDLPECSAVYLAINGQDKVQYVGRSANLYRRWIQHHRLNDLSKGTGVRIAYLEVDADLLDEVEAALIEWFDPPLNGLRTTRVPAMKDLGETTLKCRLKVLMAERDLTQRDLVDAIGLSSNTISKLYGNRFKRVDIDTIEKLLNYFECPLEGRDGLFLLIEEAA
ncbi:helix-turn-helix domain-containing protein [Synechococcus sp. PCC 7336]|uniref:helix-turn-helix domain-containing protein n=1 Tax=Synechococcus sp. PCC 7336 TaxID=195250 RepID=UPI00034D7073|nr:helix-turn-helix domain-containing protein [Synechococcus sp. PCC 7336]